MTPTAPTDRTRGQGLASVVRFNWPWYAVAAAVVVLLPIEARSLPAPAPTLALAVAGLVAASALASLAATYWVYDRSPLYALRWLDDVDLPERAVIGVFTAGFDEVSPTIAERSPTATVAPFDFYDRRTQTEASIRRARERQTDRGGVDVAADHLPLASGTLDLAVAFLAAHELRVRADRVALFLEVRRCLRPGAVLVVVEHLRDLPNLLVYNLGALHFLSRREWLATFAAAGLRLREVRAETPFVAVFVLAGAERARP